MPPTGRTCSGTGTDARRPLHRLLWDVARACLVLQLVVSQPTAMAQNPGAGGLTTITQAEQWLSEKERLIASLERADIQTSWFTLTGVAAYDEQAARLLLRRLRQQLANNQLSQKQLEALARLAIQERALAGLLPEYTGVLASIGDPGLDAFKVILGFGQALDVALERCASPICRMVQTANGRIVGQLGRNNLALLLRTCGGDSQDWDSALQAIDFAMQIIQQGLDQGRPLASLLADPSSEAAATRVLLAEYLRRTQALLDQGVRSADLAAGSGELPIRGDTSRAERLIGQLIEMARFEKGDALSRRNDFQREVDLPKSALLVADMEGLTPAVALAQGVGLEARIEQMISRFTLIGLNGKNLSCVTDLAAQAGQRAFDPTQPITPCRVQTSPNPDPEATPSAEQVPTSSVELEWQLLVAAHRVALEQLLQALTAGEEVVLQAALQRTMAAEAALEREMATWQRIAFASPQAQPDDLALTRKVDIFALRSLALYLTTAELVLARQAGSTPQTDAQQAAQLVGQALDEAVAAVQQVEVRLGLRFGLLALEEATWQTDPVAGYLQVNVFLRNVGTQPVDRAQVITVFGGVPQSAQPVPRLAPGQEHQIKVTLPPAAGNWITLQLKADSMMPDIWLVRLTAVAGGADSASPTELVSTPALKETPEASVPPSPRSTGWLLWCLPLAILITGLAFGVAFGLLVWLYHRAKRPY